MLKLAGLKCYVYQSFPDAYISLSLTDLDAIISLSLIDLDAIISLFLIDLDAIIMRYCQMLWIEASLAVYTNWAGLNRTSSDVFSWN